MMNTTLLVSAYLGAMVVGQAPKEEKLVTPSFVMGIVAKDIFNLVQTNKLRKDEIPYQVWFSLHTIPEQHRADFRRLFVFWINHLSAGRAIVWPKQLEGGLVLRIDIRDAPNWTIRAWEIVGNRDYLFREPCIAHDVTQFVRFACGVKQDPETFAAVKVLNAHQFFRESIESNKAQTYYDLLYAKQRHPDGVVVGPPEKIEVIPEQEKTVVTEWEGGIWPGDGKEYPKGSFKYNKKIKVPQEIREDPFPSIKPAKEKGDVNFPATGKDFEVLWGADFSGDILKKIGIDPRQGGIALGKDDGDGKGSFVARRTRAIRISPSPFGVVTRTFDVFVADGNKDHMRRIGNIAKGEIDFDGSEILATLPNGAQAGLLTDGKDNRAEIAPSDLAIGDGIIDKRFPDVRTHMSCIICHADFGGFITFNEQVKAAIKAGITISADDDDPKVKKEKERKIADFYLEWEHLVKGWQAPYFRFVEKTTYDEITGKSWTTQETVKQLMFFRDLYDKPVGLAQASREFGVPSDTIKFAVLVHKPIEFRPNELVVGRTIGRDQWVGLKTGAAREVFLLLDASKADDKLKQLLWDGLVEDAIKQFKEEILKEKKK